MCLQIVMKGKEKKDFLAKLPDMITVWKVVTKWGKGDYVTDCKSFSLHAGEVKFPQNTINKSNWRMFQGPIYKGGGHFFLIRQAARDWSGWHFQDRVVKCQIKKEWINNIGTQDSKKVVVVSRAIFPAFLGKKK